MDIDRVLAERLNRRGFLRMAGVTTAAAALAACRKAQERTGGEGQTGASGVTATRPAMSEEPGDLTVFDWSGYGNGDYYPKEEKQFLWGQYQQATGDKPSFVLFENDDAGYTDVAAGARYDIVHPCGYKYQDWVDLGVLQPWDTSLISNFSDLNPNLMQQGVVGGQQYFVPLDWGFIAPLVNADHVDSEDTMGVLFDERYAGKIAWVDTLNMFHVAGLFLGVSDPYDMTDEELTETRDFLISKKPLVRFMWNQSYDFWLAFKKEEVWAGYSWPDTVGYADAAGMNFNYMKPKEGRISWVCGMGLFADTENYLHAHEYVNSWASVDAAEFLMGYYYYGHTNTKADTSVVSPALVEALGLDDPSAVEPPNAIPESFMPRRDLYAQYWQEVLAA
ncbi:MAG TPA: extracellular solute-binding protein [Actinomycetota bacterium]|nr:extracellular solute-binding protein [Actinomycetota bacterium]